MAGAITSQAAEAIALQNQGSYSPSNGNVLQHTYYDTIDFQATTMRPRQALFQTPIGSSYMSGNKTLTETNLTDPGKLPNGHSFLIKEYSIALIPAVAGADTDGKAVLAAYLNIIQNSVFEFKFPGRDFEFQTHGSEFLPSLIVASADAAGNVYGGNIMSSGWLKVAATPVAIANLTSFSISMATQSASSSIQTILNTASGLLNTQLAQLQFRLRGILTRAA